MSVVGKIEGTGPVQSAKQVRKVAKTAKTGGASFASELDEASESSPPSPVSASNSVSGVLGVQEIDDALAQASKGKLRASEILDRLEDLRVQILTGALSRDKLLQLTHVVSTHRAQVSDPKLTEILDHIDLRAQVELAKYMDKPDK